MPTKFLLATNSSPISPLVIGFAIELQLQSPSPLGNSGLLQWFLSSKQHTNLWGRFQSTLMKIWQLERKKVERWEGLALGFLGSLKLFNMAISSLKLIGNENYMVKVRLEHLKKKNTNTHYKIILNSVIFLGQREAKYCTNYCTNFLPNVFQLMFPSAHLRCAHLLQLIWVFNFFFVLFMSFIVLFS